MTLGMVLTGVSGGRGEVKLKVGKAEVLMGSEMAGRSGTSTTCRSEETEIDFRSVLSEVSY